jgi:hypothetical protein
MSDVITLPTPQVEGQGSLPVEGAPGNALPGETDKKTETPFGDAKNVEKLAEKNEAGINKIADLIVAKIEDERTRNIRIGKQTLEHMVWQKSHFAAWTDKYFDQTCNKVSDRVQFLVPGTGRHPIDEYVRVHAFVEVMRPLVGDAIDRLSYFQIRNKFAPNCMAFSKVTLEGELRPAWADWAKKFVAMQAGEEKLSIKALDSAIADQAKAIADAKNATKNPALVQEEERKKKLAESARKESKCRTDLTMAIDSALDGTLRAEQVVGILEKVATDRKITLPSSGPNAATMTKDQADAFAKALFDAHNLTAMVALHQKLGQMLKTIREASLKADADAKAEAKAA